MIDAISSPSRRSEMKAHAGPRGMTILSATAAILFGVFLVFGAGLANPTTVHNAAHDVRHALAFPCH